MHPSFEGQKYLLNRRGVMIVEISKNEETSGGRKNGGAEEFGCVIHRRIASVGSKNVKEGQQKRVIY